MTMALLRVAHLSRVQALVSRYLVVLLLQIASLRGNNETKAATKCLEYYILKLYQAKHRINNVLPLTTQRASNL
jgi:hypothetical protein